MEHKSENLLTDKRDIIIAFRLTAREAAHVEAAAASLKKPRTRGDYARAVALYASRQRVPKPSKPIKLQPRRLPALDTQLLSKLLAEVGQLGSDVNQMARAATNCGTPPTGAALMTAAHDIARVRDAVIAALGGRADEVTL